MCKCLMAAITHLCLNSDRICTCIFINPFPLGAARAIIDFSNALTGALRSFLILCFPLSMRPQRKSVTCLA